MGKAEPVWFEDPERWQSFLQRARLDDEALARKLIQDLHQLAGPLAPRLHETLQAHLPENPEPIRALTNLSRLLEAVRREPAPEQTLEFIVDHAAGLLFLLGSSQYAADRLARYPAWVPWVVRESQHFRPADALEGELAELVGRAREESEVLDALRRFRHRHTIRIAYRDLVRGVSLETVTLELSELADAVIQAAYRWAYEELCRRHGVPRTESGAASRFCVLAMGKHGGQELNYSSDVDLIFLYQGDGFTEGPRELSNEEFWRRLSAQLVRLLTTHTAEGYAYRVDLRLRPEGRSGAVVRSLESMLLYYQTLGRTWERQALIKARPCAGDRRLGEEFLHALQPLIYRRYLTAEQIAEIKLIKRRIEARSAVAEGIPQDVKLSSGGIRDVEFVVQFLQLLHGAALPELRERNTLRALAAFERCGCLQSEERQALQEAYVFLRTIEHRLQLFADRQTHELPSDERGLEVLARKLGYRGDATVVRSKFLADLRRRTEANRRVLRFLLQDAFRGEGDELATVESELLLDPDPEPERIEQTLSKYGFRDVHQAYRVLCRLSSEPVPFLSSLRCRHLMAALAPRLLRELAARPNPDRTLYQLEAISGSLGARGALWELFRLHPDLMEAVLDIAAYSEMLQHLLCSNPGMMDDLVDAFELASLPDRHEMARELDELLEGARDPVPILAGFRAAYELKVGVRFLLGRDSPSAAARSLRALYLTVLERLASLAYSRLSRRYGQPAVAAGRRPRRCRWCLLVGGLPVWALGGFFDPIAFAVLYEEDGVTVRETRRRDWEPTTNQHFFHEMARAVTGIGAGILRLEPGWTVPGRGTMLSLALNQLGNLVQDLGTAGLGWYALVGPDGRFCQQVSRQLIEFLRSGMPPEPPVRMEAEALLRYAGSMLAWLLLGHRSRDGRDRYEHPWQVVRPRQKKLFAQLEQEELARPMEFFTGLRLMAQLHVGGPREPHVDPSLERLAHRLARYWPSSCRSLEEAFGERAKQLLRSLQVVLERS